MEQLRAVKLTRGLIGLAILLAAGLVVSPAQGKEGLISQEALSSDKKAMPSGETSVLPQPDRETLKQLKDAQLLIEKERFGEAVRILGTILSSPDDSFFPAESATPEGRVEIRGLHDEAEQILGALPDRAIELYELQFGAQAKQLLEKAMTEGNTRAPADISRRFFYTAAGAEATWLAGLVAMDEGRWKAAILSFKRLEKVPNAADRHEPLLSTLKAICMEQTGEHESAENTWKVLGAKDPQAHIQVAGKKAMLFYDSETTFQDFLGRTDLATLEKSSDLLASLMANQMLPFGTPQRNASVNASLPLLKRAWRARITDRPLAEGVLKDQRETRIDSDTLIVPRFYPLVVDKVLLGRTLNTLVAIDTTTGKRLWETKLDETEVVNSMDLALSNHPTAMAQDLVERIWSDSIFGQLSSDGQNVYAIEDADLLANRNNPRQQILAPGVLGMGVGVDPSQGLSNTLVAFDIKTGKPRWTRSVGAGDAPLFFLGPPLPLDGLLYILAESQGEIQLLALEATSGELDWLQQIAVVEQPTAGYMPQDTNAIMPAMSQGVMICPTSTGAIIAMEPTTRVLLWAHCYERLGKNQNRPVIVNNQQRIQNQDRIGEELLLHGDYVFSAPSDSNYLYCLDLYTGKEIWKKDFSNRAFLGGAFQDRLLVIGGKDFQVLKTENGEEIAKCDLQQSLEEDDPVFITGHGFRNENLYYAPTSSNHIVAFDIQQGRIVQQTGTHSPIILGNLVAGNDQIFSQSLDGLEAFHQLQAIREKTQKQLQENPNHLAAIAMQGELLLAEEKIDEAVEKFRQVHRAAPNITSGDRLFEAFCIALEEAYPQYRASRPEIEALLRTDRQKNEYWYRVVHGEIAENHMADAADACFRLAELAHRSPLMLSMDRSHTVRQDRFVQSQLTTIYENSDEAFREKLGQKIVAQFEATLKSGDREAIHASWNCFATLSPLVKRYDQFIDALWEIDPTLAELIFEKIARFGSPSEATTAMIRWAELLRKSGRIEDAAACYRTALQRWENVPLLTSTPQTASSRVAAMRSDDPIRDRLASHEMWPQGHELAKPEKAGESQESFNIRLQSRLIPLGTESPIFRGKQIFFSGQQIELRDEYHRQVWSVSLVEDESENAIYYGGHYGTRCSTLGHMIFVEFQDRLLAIDAWDPQQPKLAWQTERGPKVNMPGVSNNVSNFCRMHFTGFSQGMFSSNQTFLGLPGIDFGFQLLTLSGTELLAIDPFDGSLLWKQRKIPRQIDLNSNGTTLLVSQPQRRNEPPTMMSLIDGQSDELLTGKVSTTKTSGVPPSAKKNDPQGNGTEKEMARKAGELAAKLFMSATQKDATPKQKILSFGRNSFVFYRVSRKYSFELIDNLTQQPIWGTKTYDYQSNQLKWQLLGQDYVGILDPKGNFELFRIADGKTMIRHKLDFEGTLQGIFLQDWGDRIGVILSFVPKPNQRNISMSYIPITQYLQQGYVYSFYWDGRPAFANKPQGILIEQQGFLDDPPKNLPVMTFLSQHQNEQNQEKPWLTKLQVIDIRSGETIFSKEIEDGINSFDLGGDPEKKTVEYQLNNQKFTIRFQ